MMFEDDVQLIRRTLSGDESAFSTLIQKHQKGVHALVWRKVGDFHFAEEITQDVFLQVYKKLGTLKDPKCFAGWLYVIANRFCLNWIRSRKPTIQSLEDTPVEEINESSYTHYMIEEREVQTIEHRSEIVNRLLERLPESERTVVTLHYLGEMTAKEIGNFLGVSVNTIKSRLRRGRERLQGVESLVSEVLGSVPFPIGLMERIMNQVADINPVSATSGKPVLPWAALGSAVVVIVLMLSVSHQYLARFQQPYSFEARSEPTIEIVDTPIVLDIVSKPAIRNQFGRSAAPGRSIGTGTQFSEAISRSDAQENLLKFSTAQWTQTYGPPADHVHDISIVSDGTTYAFARTGMYKLEEGATTWRHLNTGIPIDEFLMPVAENRGTHYIVSTNEIFASPDKGETWRVLCVRPKGDAIRLIITEESHARRPHSDMSMYLVLRDEGIFRSIDSGIQWDPLNDGLIDERILAVAAVGKTLFIGTNRGLYRLESGFWRKLSVGTSGAVYSIEVHGSNLYVGIGPDLLGLQPYDEIARVKVRSIMKSGEPSSGRIFRSIDFGASWTEITPNYNQSALPSGVRILAAGGTLLAIGATNLSSTDGGDTWTYLGIDSNLYLLNSYPAVAVNDTTFYKAGTFGVQRTTDSGKSWHVFMDGVLGTKTNDLVVFNNRLYAHTGYGIYQSTNEGGSWKKVRMGTNDISRKSVEQDTSYITHDGDAKFANVGEILYFVSLKDNPMHILRLSEDGDTLIPIQAIPTFNDGHSFDTRLRSGGRWVVKEAFAVSRDVFYAEYERRLLKWKLGDPQWRDTGLVDLGEQSDGNLDHGFELAASGQTLYIGKRDGKLFQSLDEANSWRDITPNLPLHFTSFKEIIFVGSTVYVSTNNGIMVSQTGEHWRLLTDSAGRRPIISKFAIDGPTVYGVGDLGTYRLDADGYWQQFSSEVPGEVVSLVTMNSRLYGATRYHGIFQMSLTKE